MNVPIRLDRRALIAGGGAASLAALMPSKPAAALRPAGGQPATIPMGPAPRPIPGGIDSGDPNVGFIHWWLPGPTDATTPFIGLPGFGLDVDPSTITDFKGVSAMAVVAGTVTGSDGADYNCEFDVRAMKGRYVGVDGVTRDGAFAFI